MKIKEYLFRKGTKVTYGKGEIIIAPYNKPTGIFLIESGYIFSYHVFHDKKREIQIIFRPGELFPLTWGLKNLQKRYYYQALTDVNLRMISKKEFIHAISTFPRFSREIINILVSYLDIYVDRLENLEAKNIREKLLKRLIFLGKRFGKKYGSSMILGFPITHGFISDSINASRENVTRILNELEKDRIISFKNHRLIILEPRMLEKKLEVRTYLSSNLISFN